jgi:hypothetical protein
MGSGCSEYRENKVSSPFRIAESNTVFTEGGILDVGTEMDIIKNQASIEKRSVRETGSAVSAETVLPKNRFGNYGNKGATPVKWE